jgi:hypothetical protein
MTGVLAEPWLCGRRFGQILYDCHPLRSRAFSAGNLTTPYTGTSPAVVISQCRLYLRAFKIVGDVDVVGVGSGLTGRGVAWCRSWCGAGRSASTCATSLASTVFSDTSANSLATFDAPRTRWCTTLPGDGAVSRSLRRSSRVRSTRSLPSA